MAAAAVAGVGPPTESAQVVLLIAVFLAIGLPHGALDHLVAERVFAWSHAQLYAAYVLLAAAVFALWCWWPAVAGGAFLLLSAWHFGEGDVRGLRHRPGAGWLLVATRGALIVGLLVFGHPEEAVAGLGAWAPGAELGSRTVAVPLLLWFAHAACLVFGVREPARLRARWVAEAAILAAWLWLAPPLLGFALYFGVWHAADHIELLRGSLGAERPWSWLVTLVRGFPNALASALGLVAAVIYGTAWVDGATGYAMGLGGLAAVATPHLLLVEAWRQRATAVAPVMARGASEGRSA